MRCADDLGERQLRRAVERVEDQRHPVDHRDRRVGVRCCCCHR
jgi:hypothetical protein